MEQMMSWLLSSAPLHFFKVKNILFFMSVCVFDDVMSHYVTFSQQSDCDQSDKNN